MPIKRTITYIVSEVVGATSSLWHKTCDTKTLPEESDFPLKNIAVFHEGIWGIYCNSMYWEWSSFNYQNNIYNTKKAKQ